MRPKISWQQNTKSLWMSWPRRSSASPATFESWRFAFGDSSSAPVTTALTPRNTRPCAAPTRSALTPGIGDSGGQASGERDVAAEFVIEPESGPPGAIVELSAEACPALSEDWGRRWHLVLLTRTRAASPENEVPPPASGSGGRAAVALPGVGLGTVDFHTEERSD